MIPGNVVRADMHDNMDGNRPGMANDVGQAAGSEATTLSIASGVKLTQSFHGQVDAQVGLLTWLVHCEIQSPPHFLVLGLGLSRRR